VSLNTFKFSSKVVAVPFELLQDSSVDIEAFINRRLRMRLGRILNTRFTVGSGAGQPNGLSVAAAVGKTGVAGQTLTVIYDDLVDLIDSVDIAYQSAACKFMFSQALRKVLRKLKDTAGRPIWMPSYEAGIAGKFAETLMGFDVRSTTTCRGRAPTTSRSPSASSTSTRCASRWKCSSSGSPIRRTPSSGKSAFSPGRAPAATWPTLRPSSSTSTRRPNSAELSNLIVGALFPGKHAPLPRYERGRFALACLPRRGRNGW
jgi:hypothetical protein